MLSAKTVLYLTDESLYVYKATQKSVQLAAVYAWGMDGFEQDLVAILRELNLSVLVLNDTVDQHYRKEKVARVGFLDAAKVVERKLAIAFPNYSYRASLKQSKGEPFSLKSLMPTGIISKPDTGISTDMYLFAACPSSSNMEIVLTALQQAQSDVLGMALVPVESTDFVHQLYNKLLKNQKRIPSVADKNSSWVIFVGQNQSGGLRQIVVKDGAIALTRITPIVEKDEDPEYWAADVARELNATMTYLSRFGYTGADTLETIVICNEHVKQSVDAQVDIGGNLTCLTFDETAKLMGIDQGLVKNQRFSDVLHVVWAARKARLALPLASLKLKSLTTPRVQANYVASALLVLLAGATFFAATTFQKNYELKINLEQKRQELTQIENVFESEIRQKEEVGIDIKLVQRSLEVDKAYDAVSFDMLDTLKLIRQGLAGSIKIDSFSFDKSTALPQGLSVDANQQSDNSARIILGMSFASDVDIIAGNDEVQRLKDRLEEVLPKAKVSVTEVLKDVSYKGEIETELSDSGPAVDQGGLSAEIVIEFDGEEVGL